MWHMWVAVGGEDEEMAALDVRVDWGGCCSSQSSLPASKYCACKEEEYVSLWMKSRSSYCVGFGVLANSQTQQMTQFFFSLYQIIGS